MTKQDIIKATFIVWGRNFYTKMNLSEVSAYLGVTKPALYRHFSNKEALLEALYIDFFDRFALFLSKNLPAVKQQQSRKDKALALAAVMAEYFINHTYDFLFFLNLVLGQEKPGRVFKQELERRGLVFERLDNSRKEKGSMSLLRTVMMTVVFAVALVHIRKNCQIDESSEGPVLADPLSLVTGLVEHGLCSINIQSALPDFATLDEMFKPLCGCCREGNPAAGGTSGQILSALARAIGEQGLSDASMNIVARKAGLAKSSLYSHFASKEEMLRQLFLYEFEALANHLEAALALSDKPLDRLYLTMRVVSEYLRHHRDILLVLDWVRLQRIPLGVIIPERALQLLSFLRDLPLRSSLSDWDEFTRVRWVLFLVVNQLMVELRQGVDEAESLNNLKELYMYIVTGVNGWKA